MNKDITKNLAGRIILDILILLCVIHGWWFIALPLGLIGVWRLGLFVELMIAGIMYDSLFGFVAGNGVWGYAGTIVSIIIFVVMIFTKKMVRR